MKLVDTSLPTASSEAFNVPTVEQSYPGLTVDMEQWETEVESPQLVSESLIRPATPGFQAYDPDAIAQSYRGRFLKIITRWFRILAPTLLYIWQRWWDGRTGQEAKHERQRAIQLRETLTQLGPAYIKIGQALSTRPDLVSPVYLDELAKLQDQLPPFPNAVAYQFIEEELGHHPSVLFTELSPNPIAAASLGQVYKGKLQTGEIVAVKVQRPGLAESITLDIYILRGLATWVQQTFKSSVRSDLVAILDEFAGRLFEEMDYTHEGHNAEHFARLYNHLPDIYVPKIYWEYTHRRVLTMEWITGTKLTRPDVIQSQGIDARYLVEVGVQCSLRQLLEHGFFHADPHPGNLLAMPNGKLAYLDFGMMSEINPQQRYGLINAIVHIVNREFSALAEDYVKLGFLTPTTDLRPIIPALATVFSNALGASVAELNFQSMVNQLSEIMYEYPFRVPAYYALIIRSLVTMEGIAIGIDPNFKVLSSAYPYVAKRLLTDQAPELRSSLRDLLFKDGNFRWNRLENLLRNARDSSDYDFNAAMGQALDFLFSERGEFIRDRIADEVVKAIDGLSQNALHNVAHLLRDPLNLKPPQNTSTLTTTKSTTDPQQTAEHLKRIWGLLMDTPGFEPAQLLPVITQVLVKPETQRLGRRIASHLVQKILARFIREFLLPEDTTLIRTGNGQLAYPAAHKVSLRTPGTY